MSGAVVAASIVAAATIGSTIYSSEQQKKSQEKALEQQKKAQTEAKTAAEVQAKSSEQAINAANKKSPDISSIMSEATQDAKGGAAGTMLTGPQGIDPNQLSLGKSTLLGS